MMKRSGGKLPTNLDRRHLVFSIGLLHMAPSRFFNRNVVKIGSEKITNWMPMFSDFNLSPNGETVVFEVGSGGVSLGLGLYDWRRNRIRRIPNPRDGYFSDGSFSSDGKMLCAVKVTRVEGVLYSNIVQIDGNSFHAIDITKPVAVASFVSYPVFQPQSNNIMFCEWRDPGPTTLQLLISSSGGAVSFMNLHDGFSRIFRPSFISGDSIIFSGRHPRGTELKSKLGPALLNGEHIYRVRQGGHPELAFPNIETSSPQNGVGYCSVSCTQNADKVIALGLNLYQPYGPSGQFNYEIFQLNDNHRPTQITNLRGSLGFCRVSYLGSTVCFGSREGRDSPIELNLLDLMTGTVTRTNLRRQLESNPEFSPA